MLYRLAQLTFWLYFTIWHRCRIYGLPELRAFLAENPTVILAANHASYLDPPLIGMAFPKQLRFVAWDALFNIPFVGMMIRLLGAVPVDVNNKNSSAALLRQVTRFIEDDHMSVLIFPEGSRTTNGKLLPLEGGAALVALKTQVPIIPVWLEGTFEAYPPHLKYPRPYKIRAYFGKPILPVTSDEMTEKAKRGVLLNELQNSLEEMRDSIKR